MLQNSNVHIGKQIEQEVRRQRLSVQWLADQLCYERSNIYRIFRTKSIDTETLYKISILLKYNFFELYHIDTAEKE